MIRSPRARLAGLAGLAVLAVALASTLLDRSVGAGGIPPGQRLAPFAAPLVRGSLLGDADIATHADQGSSGRVPACAERGAQILNVCQLYEGRPLVLALFIDAGSCTTILGKLQALAGEFPGVRFAAVAIRGSRGPLRALLRARHVTLPVGIDADGAVGALYKVLTCPQVNFAYPGGVVQSRALLGEPSLATLRRRVRELAVASRTRQRARERGAA